MELPWEALRQWRTNVLARRVWRRAWLSAHLLSIVAMIAWPSNWMPWAMGLAVPRAAAVGPKVMIPLLNMLQGTLSVLANPLIPMVVVAAGWSYRRTFLEAVEMRALPLPTSDRLWTILIPAGRLAAATLALVLGYAALQTCLLFPGRLGIHGAGTAVALSASALVRRFIRLLVELPFCGLLAVQACRAHGRGIAALLKSLAVPVLLQIFFAAVVDTACRRAMTLEFLPLSTMTLPQQVLVSSVWDLPAAATLACIQIPIMTSLMRRAMRRAEAELFTPDAVERWEARRR